MTEVYPAEAVEGYETLAEDDFNRLLNGVGNHEAKLLTTAIIGSQPERWFTRNELYREVTGCQGSDVGWGVSPLLPGNYCDKSLGPIGIVVADEIEGKQGPVRAFQATEFGKTCGLAFTGGLLDWSLRYPDTSLQKLLGTTNSATAVRSPETRYQLLTELSTNPADEVSFVDIVRSIDDERFSLPTANRHLHDLERLGFVSIASVMQDYNPILEVVDPTYRHISIELEQASVTTRTVYKTIEWLYRTDEKEVTLDRLLELCQKIEPGIDIQPLYNSLVGSTSVRSGLYPGLVLTDRNGAPIKRNSVKIAADHTEAIEDLLYTLDCVQTPRNRQAFIERAKGILSDPDACSAIMAKARRFSSVYAGSTEGSEVTNQRMVGIIKKLGAVTALEIRDELSKDGRAMSRNTVMRLLGNLAQTGKINVVAERLDVKKKTKINRYSVADPR